MRYWTKGAIQRKERFVREWVVAYDLHRNKFNKAKAMRTALGEPYRDAWDSWPEKVWKSDNDSVVLVQADIQQDKNQRTRGVLQCVWNNVRSLVRTPRQETPAVAVKEEEPDGGNEPVRRPTVENFHKILLWISQHSIVQIKRPSLKLLISRQEAMKMNLELEESCHIRLHSPLSGISIESNENPKIWDTPPGAAAKNLAVEIEKLNAVKWTKKAAEEIYVRAAEKAQRKLSDKEMTLFRWMCFHIYLGGTPTSNRMKQDVFGYFHGATSAQCVFVYEKMKGPGITGLYASCGYTKYVPELDTWSDEYVSRVTDMDPLTSESYEWCANKRNAISLRLVWVVSQLMNAYQRHHIDLCTALALSDREWELWCQQWHMYKRDYAIGITHGIMPRKDAGYEVVCLYLEALTRIEVQEQPSGKKAKSRETVRPSQKIT